MKKYGLIPVITFLILSACDYKAPLVGEASLPIDQALLGTWEEIAEDQTGQESLERMVIRQESANRYAITYGDDRSESGSSSVIYLNGWLAELEGIQFVQLKFTGTNEGPVGPKDTDLFSVMSYTLDNGELVFRSLNTDLVDKDLADTAALQAAFTANRDDPCLFVEPGKFRKLPDDGPDSFREKQ